jgi:hypothetical protein
MSALQPTDVLGVGNQGLHSRHVAIVVLGREAAAQQGADVPLETLGEGLPVRLSATLTVTPSGRFRVPSVCRFAESLHALPCLAVSRFGRKKAT